MFSSSLAPIFSRLVQSLKRPRQARKLKDYIRQEKAVISKLSAHQEVSGKRGTLLIKCDDIGDFMMWQQVIPVIIEQAEKPICLVGNIAWKPLVEAYFDFADTYIWIDKSQWGDANYRRLHYQKVMDLQAKMAFTPLFTRNYKMDDMLLMASHANERIAWDASHHAYFPAMKPELADVTTKTFSSSEKIKLEYFRNIEFIRFLYPAANIEPVFKPLFPNFKKQNRLVLIPLANAASRCWDPDHFVDVIRQVAGRFDSILLLGAKEAMPVCEYIEKNAGCQKLMNLSGQTHVNDMIAFIGESSLVVCPDTFALHVAVLTATDVIVLSNGTNWQRFTDYRDHIKSCIRVIYHPGFKEKKDRLKRIYSRSEIQSIPASTVVNVIREFAPST
jgi:ADP-heptose:LPS heptosyltransferase